MLADRDASLLAGLLSKLRSKHFERIGRALGITKDTGGSVSSRPLLGGKPGEFEIVITSPRPPNAQPILVKFTKERVFGGTLLLSREAHAVQKKACDYANDVIREALQARHII